MPAGGPFTVDGVDVLHQQLLVEVALQVAHAQVQLGLLLGLERVLHIQLEAAQQERLEQLEIGPAIPPGRGRGSCGEFGGAPRDAPRDRVPCGAGSPWPPGRCRS